MVQQGCGGNGIGLLATVEVHEYLGGGTGHAEVSLAGVDIVASSQEIGVQGRVMQQCLEDDRLVAGLSHVPHATGTLARARVLVGVVLDIDLRGRVINPFSFAICLMSVSSPI